MAEYFNIVEEIATGIVATAAPEIDKKGLFPQLTIDALRDAGLLGLISARDMGGMGEGPRAAAMVVERFARECGSTAMILCMHFAAAGVVEKYGSEEVRRQFAEGKHLGTLAFSETGSRSYFWAPVGTAVRGEHDIYLNGKKSWVTSAHHATLYVWSSKPIAAKGASTLWLVPRNSRGISAPDSFDGLGLRGNDSTPVTADDVRVSENNMLGKDGEGLTIMLDTVLPLFNVMTAAAGIGLMEGATTAACKHASDTCYEHLDSVLCDLPTIRAYLARMRIATDQTRCLWLDTLDAIETNREDAMLRVLECKAAAGESATQVLDTAMRVCGGAAFRREVGVERRFRDARAGTVMAPTTDQLYDFIGKTICGLPIF
ncbi:Acyl-CoA dehydrogenase [Nitrosomonas cryotolerans]|uniref:Acyl-CoA dehydrogenase n=1 Tax=Nitrosomonas cryotolerans ATCC 49181 TaxID=1131553 RepID=A0A1N6HSG8_9PROT|nr:acyl-CoA dehydrogenase family protein [Nitrosomonas cryotolerans]SFP95728.1 Acyl-CoA dehydrogenase [Nitrosomonas cryotolerans]SIO22680.1 Acyl-CoA dehydrogenase [Nitrosomonas cryotolerans ATCC 49181]